MHPAISINTLSLAPAGFQDKANRVARLGACAISALASEVGKTGIEASKRVLSDAGLTLSNLTYLKFAFATPDNRKAGQEGLMRAIDMAAALGAPNVLLITGPRGRMPWPQAAQRFTDAIVPCAEQARNAGVTLSIEPVSPFFAHASFVHLLSDAAQVARTAGIGVTPDAFACWTDADIETAIADAGPLITLVQISDYVFGDSSLPCRAVPGDGAIPLRSLIAQIAATGFTGFYDLEMLGPRINAEGHEAALSRAAAHVSEILEGLPQ